MRRRNYRKLTGFDKSINRKKKVKKITSKKSLEVKHNILGSKNLSYTDTYASSSYPWTRLAPVFKEYSEAKYSKLRSLKEICAVKLAEAIEDINSSHLDLAPWEVWKIVWDEVLKKDKDTLHAFSLFASKFSDHSNFRSHKKYNHMVNKKSMSLLDLRTASLNSVLIPNTKRHRLENIFSNISMSDIAKYIHGLSYQPFVLLDLSGIHKKLTKEDYFMIFNIPNLIALDVSNSEIIDDNFLYNLRMSISKNNKLKKLTILKFNNCPNVSNNGVQSLMELSNAISTAYSLSYVECSNCMIKESFAARLIKNEDDATYVKGTRWMALDERSNNTRILLDMPLGLKLHILYRHYFSKILKDSDYQHAYDSTTNSLDFLYKAQNKLMLDIMLHFEPMFETQIEDAKLKIQNAWQQRLNTLGKISPNFVFCYVIDNSLSDQHIATSSTVSQRSKLSEVDNTAIPTSKRKKRLIQMNAEKFFDL